MNEDKCRMVAHRASHQRTHLYKDDCIECLAPVVTKLTISVLKGQSTRVELEEVYVYKKMRVLRLRFTRSIM